LIRCLPLRDVRSGTAAAVVFQASRQCQDFFVTHCGAVGFLVLSSRQVFSRDGYFFFLSLSQIVIEIGLKMKVIVRIYKILKKESRQFITSEN
jgi:hypothetical protein